MGINDVDHEGMKTGIAKIRQNARQAVILTLTEYRNFKYEEDETIVSIALQFGKCNDVKEEAVLEVLPEFRAQIEDLRQLGVEIPLGVDDCQKHPSNAYLKPWDMISSKEEEPPKNTTLLVKTNGGDYALVRYCKTHGWLHEKGMAFRQEIHYWKILV